MKDSSHKGAQRPYRTLGTYLKRYREKRSESLVEVSGAVEIEPDALERIEDGQDRPSEDILMLLINHFEVQDQDAVHLWESAGYDGEDSGTRRHAEMFDRSAVVLLAMDARIVYSDGVSIDANKAGLVMNFTQASPTRGQQQVVGRIGMSYEEAERVVASLQTAILYGRHNPGPRQLPPSASV